jgi:hypothetical protein
MKVCGSNHCNELNKINTKLSQKQPEAKQSLSVVTDPLTIVTESGQGFTWVLFFFYRAGLF